MYLYIVENYVAGYRAARQLILQCIYLAIAVLYAILTSNDQLYKYTLISKFYSHIVWLALEWYIHTPPILCNAG